MKRIYVPTEGPEDWRRLLAKPDRHWREGFSAKALAKAWEEASGFPRRVEAVLEPSFEGIEPLIILPEYKTPLPGGSRPSQSDVWCLARTDSELVSIAVEGKVSESFGKPVAKWNPEETPGKQKRFAFLKETLGLDHIPENIRYQLIHRTASALIEADRFTARHAVLLVHSFSRDRDGFDDFAAFVALFGCEPGVDQMVTVDRDEGPNLHFAWVQDRTNPFGR